MNTALTVAALAAGLAILALCIVVLYFMDPRLRIGTAALWLAAAAGATWLLADGIKSDLHPLVVVAAATAAVLGWLNVRRLISFATTPIGIGQASRHAGALTLAVACLLAPALSGCITTGNLLDAEGFPQRYVSILGGITQGRQAVALAVIAGAMSPAEAVKKTEELDKAAVKLGLDRMVRAINTPEMDAALAKDNEAKASVSQALATVAAPR